MVSNGMHRPDHSISDHASGSSCVRSDRKSSWLIRIISVDRLHHWSVVIIIVCGFIAMRMIEISEKCDNRILCQTQIKMNQSECRETDQSSVNISLYQNDLHNSVEHGINRVILW